MIQITNDELERALTYDVLIPKLREAFSRKYNFPKRHHHQVPNPKTGVESTLLLMPAWDEENLGVKLITVSPTNGIHDLPTIQGTYTLFDLQTGSPKAQMDAKLLTIKRTAATSALASDLLSNPGTSSMLMIGTGALSRELISAHRLVRPIEKVYVWGRNFHKAKLIAESFADDFIEVIPVEQIEDVIREVDLISCATLSPTPLISGKYLMPGQHYDLVGAYKPDMREADDTFITNVSLHVDTYEGASTETGDLAIPIKSGAIRISDLKSELSELCTDVRKGRHHQNEITCFKSVGHALEDLAAATLAYESHK